MYFGFTDEQREFGDAVAALLEHHSSPETVRLAWSAAPGQLDRSAWTALTDMGVLSACASEANGGLGLDEVWLALPIEQAGRFALAAPLVETALVAAQLPGVPADGAMIASNLGGRYVPMAADADQLLLQTGDGRELHLVPRAAVELVAMTAVDRSRRLAQVEWTPTPATLITDDEDLIGRSFDRGACGTAALLVGLADTMIKITTEYVSERRQFGVPVGSFQAVKHHLANGLLELSFARPAVYRAAWSIATDALTRSRDVSMAKAMASQAATVVGRVALQCHGAVGYTVEHDLHLFLKRANALAAAWGDVAFHRARVGRSLAAG